MRDSTGQVADPVPSYVRWERHLPGLLQQLAVRPEGVVQVGAHIGQEVRALAQCGFRRLVLMEPNRRHRAQLRRQLELHHPGSLSPVPDGGLAAGEIVLAAAGRRRGRATLHVTEHDQQASLLEPKLPMRVTSWESIPVVPLRDVQHGCNVLVADVQGAELEVLAGADLEHLELAVIEGSTWPRYEGGATLESVAAFMTGHGWQQVATFPHAQPQVTDVAWLAPRAGELLVAG